MEDSGELEWEMFADGGLRHGSERSFEADALVAIVDEQVEVLEEVFAEYAATCW